MAGNAFENLSKIFLTDTFRAWFDKTNQVINTINPLEIYGVTAATGENAGITISIDSGGMASIGISFPRSLTGDFVFGGGVTFTQGVNISGLTLDLNPEGSTGATVYGRIVRSFNGMTGDVTFTSVGGPGGITSGDILYYNAAGTTYVRYPLFAGGTAAADYLSIGASGGIFVGVTAGGVSAASNIIRKGHLQLAGSTASLIYMIDGSNTSYTTSATAGAEIRYGKLGTTGPHLFTIGGRNFSGVRSSYENFVINFDTKRVSIGGITTPSANLSIADNANGNIFAFHNSAGGTLNMRFITGGSDGGRTGGGATGISAYGGHPATKSLKGENRYRFEQIDGSIEFEITGSGRTSGFMVYGSDSSNGFGTLLTPTLHARRDGNVVIGGLSSFDGGTTGSTHGSLNIVSGKLYLGGTLGSSSLTGANIIQSSGSSGSWRKLELRNAKYSGTITNASNYYEPITKILQEVWLVRPTTSEVISFKREDSVLEETGSFQISVKFPEVRMIGTPHPTNQAILGVFIYIDGVRYEMPGTINFKEVYQSGTRVLSPVFSYSGTASQHVRIEPFMTHGKLLQTSTMTDHQAGFVIVSPGSYSAEFSRIG